MMANPIPTAVHTRHNTLYGMLKSGVAIEMRRGLVYISSGSVISIQSSVCKRCEIPREKAIGLSTIGGT